VGGGEEKTLDLNDYLSALRGAAEPTRLRLLALCAASELTVSELTQIMGQSQPRVSRHLKLMVDAGLLERFREGTWAFYRLATGTDQARAAATFVDMVPLGDPVIRRDTERLDAIKADREAAATAYFRKNAAQWDEMRRLRVDDAEVERAVLDVLDGAKVGAMLDIGTGTGRMLSILGPRVGSALGIDRSHDMLAVARANLEHEKLINCSVRLGDMYGINAESESFDLVTVHLVLHYADQPGQVIAEARRVLAPGGRLLLVDFAPHELEHLRGDHAHRRLGFSDPEIESWCHAAGLALAPAISLPGDPLTVQLWLASRSGAGAGAASAKKTPLTNKEGV
jgi:ubiquinone/menaquinone biosynthesis C-methylase UbiE